MEETTLDSVDAIPSFKVDNPEREDSNEDGIGLPAAERLEMTESSDERALETDAAAKVKPARSVIVLRSPVKVRGIDPRSVPLSTIELARAGGMTPSGKAVGEGDEAAASAAATDAEEANAPAAASCDASVAGGEV